MNDVSIGFDLYPECSVCGEDFRECEHWFDEAHINAKDMDVFELSIVTRGADADAKASAQNFKAQFNDKIQKHPKEDVNNMNFTEGGKSMPEKPEDNKMVDIGEMVTKLSDSEQKAATAEAAKVQAEQELAAMKQEKEALEQEKEALRVEKEAAENKATDFEEKFTTTSTKLSDKQLTDKKTEVLSIVEDKLAKNLITEEQKDAEVETLMKVEDLQPIKDLVAQFDKPKARQDGKIPEIQNGTKQMGATTDKVDYDKLCKDPKFVQAMVHEIFKYDRVYHAPRKDKQPQASYMGLRKNNLDASSVNL